MYLYSINDLHHELKETEYYQKKRPSIKPVLVDKVNFLLNSIIHPNRTKYKHEIESYDSVPLLSSELAAMLGNREYTRIIEVLEKLDILKVNHSYISKETLKITNRNRKKNGYKTLKKEAQSKTYSLTDKALNKGIKKVGLLSPRMENKINAYRKKTIQEYLNEPMHEKIINSTFQVDFIYTNKEANEALNKYEPDTVKGQFFTETYNELKEISTYSDTSQYLENSNYYYTQSKKVNRVYHYYTTIPKAYREALRHKDGSQLSEIDLSNAQPLILGLDYHNSKTTLTRSDKELKEDLLKGNFYERIAKQALKNNDAEFYNLYENNYGEFKAKVLGEGLYFNYIPDFKKIKPAEKYLLQLYPDFIQYIRNEKRLYGYKYVSHMAQRKEASIFITGIFKNLNQNDFALPVHDALIIKEKEVEKYLNKLVASFKTIFPLVENPRELFKIKNYG